MNTLSKKFIFGIVFILVSATLCSILFHHEFIEKYYVFQKRILIKSICENFSNDIKNGMSANEAMTKIENSDKVIITKIENTADKNNDTVNDEIRNAFQEKGIGFQKYWLWEVDYEQILNGENRIRLYNQDRLNYSLLVEYTLIDSQLFAITMIIPNIADAFGTINTFLMAVNIITIMIAIIFISILTRKITKPLKKFESFAYHMGNNKFIPLTIHTNDELENVADNLNVMGNQIISYQNSLQEKNKQMEQLLADVAHDLKTPVSLIKLYTDGIKDGLDDGTFLETIQQQNTQINQMINKLLFLTRIDKESLELEECNISNQIQNLLREYAILAKERHLEFILHMEDNIVVNSNLEWLESLFSNLITNAIKYSSGSQIEVTLKSDAKNIIFTISNKSNNENLKINEIWNPYYVGEKSRNKHFSGTGLGLSMVKKLSTKLNYDISCTLVNQLITFTLKIPLP